MNSPPRIARLRTLPVIALVIMSAAFWSDTAHGVDAVTPNNRPTIVSGETNGELSAGSLIQIAPGCRIHRAAAPSAALLLESARSRGVSLSTNDCYRPLSGQVAVSQQWTNAGNSSCAAPVAKSPTGTVKGTSMHGWGKAVDFSFGGGSWNSVGYRFLKDHAATYGWNHPGWAEPGGSSCPEAWHWEWVGDGGQDAGTPVRADVVALLPSSDDQGYATVTGLGAVTVKGNATDYGSAAALPLSWVMVDAVGTPDRKGYWMVGADGGVFSYGNAAFHGSTGAMKLNQPVIAMAPTPTGLGYWLVAADGGVFSFGDAVFHGSTGAMKLNKPVVGVAASPTGNGYWLVASDGGVFAFGDAVFHGSTGAIKLNQPVVGITAAPSGAGYWMVASDGGLFAFGAAPFYGSAGASPPAQPVVGIARTKTGAGYWITVANGEVLPYGDAKAFGSG